MYIRYAASIKKIADDKANWAGDSVDVFENVANSAFYTKEIYFYPSQPPEPVWLWVLGHEKALPSKAITDRLWQTRWCFHICVGGKGNYNGRPIRRGDCFLAWPYFKHSIIADANDPLEFYWLIFRGDKLNEYVYDKGFRSTQLIFKTENVEPLIDMFELGMSIDYENTDIYKCTMGLANMIFSYLENIGINDDENSASNVLEKNYTSMARQLLRDSNYSLSVEALAQKIGIHANYLGKVFYRDKGERLKHYIKRKRIETATGLLANGISPTDVAYAVGYKNYSAFYSAFVKSYSISPKQYAKNLSDRE